MRTPSAAVCGVLLVISSATTITRGDDIKILPDTLDGGSTREMLRRYFQRQVDQAWERWQSRYAKLKKPEQIAAYQKQRRDFFTEAIGGFPERTPLNARVTGVVKREGFRVEKVVFESQPKHYVTAALFLPNSARHKGPYPGVLVACGHSANGKAYDEYQRVSALLALNGCAALIYDPIDQGERAQLLGKKGQPLYRSVAGHDMIGVGSILLGRNTARFRIWDGMRAIDYLQSRPEVNPERIGCTGNSGGGTLTSYLMALDDRIFAAAPSCYLTNLPALIRTIGPQDAEQSIHGQLAFGMDQTDYILMRAPKPTLICAATKDFFNIEGTWATHRYAKRLYSRMGFAERVDLIESDAKHGFGQPLRQGAVRWMMRWLRKSYAPITEPEIKVLAEKEIWATPKGQTSLLDGARSVYDLNEDYEKELAERRRRIWSGGNRAKLLDQVRRIAGIRRLDELAKPTVRKVGTLKREGYHIDKLIIEPEKGIYLPALMFVSGEATSPRVVLYLNENGKAVDAGADGEIEKIVKTGRNVLAVDIRGTGPTQLKNWRQMNTPYLLGRSFMGMRAEDVLTCARHAASGKTDGVDLIAVGNVGVPALHAASLEPGLFKSVKLTRTLARWSDVVRTRPTKNQWINAVHGVLKVYDLPDLAATLGDKVTIDQPANAQEKPAKPGA